MAMTPLGQIDEDVKRTAYLIVVGLGLLVSIFLMVVDDLDEPFLRILYPSLVVLTAAMTFGIWRRMIPLRAVEILLFAVPCAALFGSMAFWVLGPPIDDGDTIGLIGTMTWVALLFPLAYLAFGTRRGSQVNLSIYVLFLAANIPLVVDAAAEDLAEDVVGMSAIGFMALYLILIALLWVLASRLEQLVAVRARAELLEDQASTDMLTGIANRRSIDDSLDRLVAAARRSGRPLSLILIDLDHFKTINDTYGHQAGDAVLVAAVERLLAAIRKADVLGRWGGEEFLLLAPDTDAEAALGLAERCRQALASEPMHDAGIVTASFGVTELAPDDDQRTAMRRADLALYAAKSEGRDRVVVISDLEGSRPSDPAEYTNGGSHPEG